MGGDDLQYYKYADFSDFVRFSGRGRSCNNIVGAFDIETTRYDDKNNDSFAFMYIWQFAVNDLVVYGRTWSEFVEFLDKLKNDLQLSVDHRLIVYVHFLSYELNFMRTVDGIYFGSGRYDFLARDKHDIVKCVVNDVYEFRDSFAYSECALDKLSRGTMARKLKMDYDIIRTSDTILTEDELKYCENDVLILTQYFRGEMLQYGTVANIPLTCTQIDKRILHNNMREMTFFNLVKKQNGIDPSNADDVAMLQMLIDAYCAPFTYAQSVYNDIVIDDVAHSDISSFYPALMLTEKYPFGKFEKMADCSDSVESIISKYDKKPYICKLHISGLKNRYPRTAYLPNSDRYTIHNADKIGGRILRADDIILSVTDIDLKNILYFYEFDAVDVLELWVAKRYAPLPGYVLKTVVDLYDQKRIAKLERNRIKKTRPTTSAEDMEYDRIKSKLDRMAGIFVQRPMRYTYTIDPNNGAVYRSDDECYTRSENDCLVNYSWGVWLLAYARDVMYKKIYAAANLENCNGTYRNNDRIVYGDTDCVVYPASDTGIINIISDYNNYVNEKLIKFCEKNVSITNYKNLRGIGQFDTEIHKKFKCCSLKRYAYVDNHGAFRTVCAGLSRCTTYFDQFDSADEKFKNFNNEMYIAAGVSGVKKKYYRDSHVDEMVTDYQGNSTHVVVDSYVVIDDIPYCCDDTQRHDDTISRQTLKLVSDRRSLCRRLWG